MGVALVVSASPAWAASSYTGYVATFNSDAVIPIDTATNTVPGFS